MNQDFPRTKVAGISLPRLIIGCNWVSGFSHQGPARDAMILEKHHSPESVADIFEVFLQQGVNACLGLFGVDKDLHRAVLLAQERTGKQMILLDEPVLNMENTPAARKEAEAEIKKCAQRGATFCLPLHSCVEELLNRGTKTIDRLPDYLAMIRDAGMIPGLSAHMPEVIQYTDLNEYDVETYIQIFNCLGFLMQVEIESVVKIIHSAKKPVLTIKPCAAGRTTPLVGLNFAYNTIREQDMVCIGCLDKSEAEEDIEYARAAIERRLPNIRTRNSPLVSSVIKAEV